MSQQEVVCSVCNNRRPKLEWKRDFTYAELHAATQGFSLKNFLSEGGYGSVYKGVLHGHKIAVKKHVYASHKAEREFKSEVDALSKARHENVVMLLGSCSEGSHRLLVYEYVCNGSLDPHLSRITQIKLNFDSKYYLKHESGSFYVETLSCSLMLKFCVYLSSYALNRWDHLNIYEKRDRHNVSLDIVM